MNPETPVPESNSQGINPLFKWAVFSLMVGAGLMFGESIGDTIDMGITGGGLAILLALSYMEEKRHPETDAFIASALGGVVGALTEKIVHVDPWIAFGLGVVSLALGFLRERPGETNQSK